MSMIYRSGCPADWVWIVPPMSSSITPVFHQEMSLYYLKPSFEYQEAAWRTHVWKAGGDSDNKPRRKFHFKQIARLKRIKKTHLSSNSWILICSFFYVKSELLNSPRSYSEELCRSVLKRLCCMPRRQGNLNNMPKSCVKYSVMHSMPKCFVWRIMMSCQLSMKHSWLL